MRFKNQELLTSAILYLFPWTGSLFGGWYLAEGILPSHRYEIPAAVLTLLWAYGAYPLYCRIAARNGLDPVRIRAPCTSPPMDAPPHSSPMKLPVWSGIVQNPEFCRANRQLPCKTNVFILQAAVSTV